MTTAMSLASFAVRSAPIEHCYEYSLTITDLKNPTSSGNGLAGAALCELIKQRHLPIKAYENLFVETLEPQTIAGDDDDNAIPPLDIKALFKSLDANVAAA